MEYAIIHFIICLQGIFPTVSHLHQSTNNLVAFVTNHNTISMMLDHACLWEMFWSTVLNPSGLYVFCKPLMSTNLTSLLSHNNTRSLCFGNRVRLCFIVFNDVYVQSCDSPIYSHTHLETHSVSKVKLSQPKLPYF